MKTIKALNKLDACDRVHDVADRIQTVCLILNNVEYLASASGSVSVYSAPVDVREDIVSLCVSELLSAADKLNTLGEDCTTYAVENNETE